MGLKEDWKEEVELQPYFPPHSCRVSPQGGTETTALGCVAGGETAFERVLSNNLN